MFNSRLDKIPKVPKMSQMVHRPGNASFLAFLSFFFPFQPFSQVYRSFFLPLLNFQSLKLSPSKYVDRTLYIFSKQITQVEKINPTQRDQNPLSLTIPSFFGSRIPSQKLNLRHRILDSASKYPSLKKACIKRYQNVPIEELLYKGV